MTAAPKNLADLAETEKALRAAVQLDPRSASAHLALGEWLASNGCFAPAIASLTVARALDPQKPESHLALAAALRRSGRMDEALGAARAAAARFENLGPVLGELAHSTANFGRIEEAVELCQRAVELSPAAKHLHDALIFMQQHDPSFSPARQLQEQIRWRQRHADPLRGEFRAFANHRDPRRRLRIGYLSQSFWAHADSFFLLPLISHHNRADFHLTAYCNGKKTDEVTGRFQAAVDRWRPIRTLSNTSVAQLIRDDQIDILVECALHTGDNRLLVSARRPAPISVAWLGYLGSTGLDTINYLFTDPHVEPAGADGAWCSEQPWRLPTTWCCYDPRSDLPLPDLPPASANGRITFGSFHRLNKLNRSVLGLWRRVLEAVPNSRLRLMSPPGMCRQEIARALSSPGAGFDRVDFIDALPREEYLKCYSQVDIVLDAFPYNGVTTTCDALWMGVPVLTLSGQTMAGRIGRSLLINTGLADWVAESEAEFVRLAVRFAADLPLLADLRSHLRLRLACSPVMDAAGFASAVEAAYRQMWSQWCSAPV